MFLNRFLAILFLIAWVPLAHAELPNCENTTQPDKKDVAVYNAEKGKKHYENLCKIGIDSIHPTQFAVGEFEVQKKIAKATALDKKGELKNYLEANPEPVVIGPNGEYYIIDHHHLARALAEIDRNSHTFAVILENHYNVQRPMPMDEFWKLMEQKGWVYLIDEKGNQRTVKELETQVSDVMEMADDPFRSLAGEVRCEKDCAEDGSSGFIKTDVPFEEFKWAEHFRKMASFNAMTNSNLEKFIKPAIAEIARLKGKLPADER